MGVQVDIFGSCVCRDIIRNTKKGDYEVNRCIGSIPITTLYEPPLSVREFDVDKLALSVYDKRMLKIQLKRNAVNLLRKSDSQILIMDLVEEAMKRCQSERKKDVSIAYQEENEKVIQEAFADELGKNNPVRTVYPNEQDFDHVEKKYRQFAKEIVQSEENPYGYPEKNIIVIEAFYTEKWVGNLDGVLHLHDAKYPVKEINEWLKKLYGILYTYMPMCQVIKLPVFTHTTENHLRGKHPLSYTMDTYSYYAKALDVLCGKSKVNSVDNLYEEQCLQNKLYTRVLNSNSIYSISSLKKEIKALQEEVETLKNEISQMRNQYGETE